MVTANAVPCSAIPFTQMIKAVRYAEISVLKRATRRHIPEDGILRSHRSETLKSVIALTGWAL
jgi:hypothetical protein